MVALCSGALQLVSGFEMATVSTAVVLSMFGFGDGVPKKVTRCCRATHAAQRQNSLSSNLPLCGWNVMCSEKNRSPVSASNGSAFGNGGSTKTSIAS